MRHPARFPASRLARTLRSGLATLAALAWIGCGGDPETPADAADTAADDAPGEDTEPEGLPDATADAPPGDSGATDEPDAVLDATLPDVPDGCQPQCEGKECGPDGCNGVCNFCLYGDLCVQGKCTPFCKAKCDGKKCGDDGCGGKCGVCDDGFHCADDSLCHPDACVGDCGAKKCGLDACGKACGLCADGDWCDAGTCKPGPCKGIPLDKGKCDGDVLLQCVGEGPTAEKQLTDCTAKPGKICGYDPVAGQYACIDKPACTAVCQSTRNGQTVKRECGDDGCGSVCGVCTSGWSCPEGRCVPQKGAPCGPLPPQGACEGTVWMFCNTGKIDTIDCQADLGQACGWDAKLGKFGCLDG